jgi:hypothetical protein
MPVTWSSGRIADTRVLGNIIKSAYAFAWFRKLSQVVRLSSRSLRSGLAIRRLNWSLGLASGENQKANRAAKTAREYANDRGSRSTSD